MNIRKIRKLAVECRDILRGVNTVEDLIDLRHIGISENEIQAIDIGDGLLDSYHLHELNPNTEIKAILLRSYSDDGAAIQNIYMDQFKTMTFDVYDEDYDSIILSNMFIHTLEDAFAQFLEDIENALNVLVALPPKAIYKQYLNKLARIRDTYEIALTAEYIRDNFDVDKDSAFNLAEEVRERMDEESESIELESKMIKEVAEKHSIVRKEN